jgi:thymidylate synthase ThyX
MIPAQTQIPLPTQARIGNLPEFMHELILACCKSEPFDIRKQAHKLKDEFIPHWTENIFNRITTSYLIKSKPSQIYE